MRRTQKDPLLRGRHLRAGGWLTLALQAHGQAVQLHAELPVGGVGLGGVCVFLNIDIFIYIYVYG